jgi:hypothetical protein
MEDDMPRTITAGDVEVALRSAAIARASAPRCTAQQLADARTTWAWLGWVSHQEAQVLQARAAGASWSAVGRHAGLGYQGVRHVHRAAMAASAARLNGALAG